MRSSDQPCEGWRVSPRERTTKEEGPPEDKKSLQLLTQEVFVFLKGGKLLERIMLEFLSMEFHRPWQVGGREIWAPQMTAPRPCLRKVHSSRQSPSHERTMCGLEPAWGWTSCQPSTQNKNCFLCTQLVHPFSRSQLPRVAHPAGHAPKWIFMTGCAQRPGFRSL